jgi:hypothetical protein
MMRRGSRRLDEAADGNIERLHIVEKTPAPGHAGEGRRVLKCRQVGLHGCERIGLVLKSANRNSCHD